VFNLHAKVKVSRFNHSRDMERVPKILTVGHVTPSRTVNRRSPVTPYLDSPTPICLFTKQLYNFPVAAMTIKGSLLLSITIVKRFGRKFFVHFLGQILTFLGKTGSES